MAEKRHGGGTGTCHPIQQNQIKDGSATGVDGLMHLTKRPPAQN